MVLLVSLKHTKCLDADLGNEIKIMLILDSFGNAVDGRASTLLFLSSFSSLNFAFSLG